MLVSASAFALDPKTSTRVDTVTISDVYGEISADNDSTLLVGVEGCQRAMDADADIMVTFSTPDFDVSSNDMVTGVFYYHGVYTFETGRGTGSSPTCTSSGCVDVSSDYISRSSTQAVVNIPFKTLTGFTSAQDCLGEIEKDIFIRLQFYDGSSSDAADAKVTLDLIRPEPLVSFDAVVTQDAMELTWEPGSSNDVDSYRVVYSTEEFAGDDFADNVSGAKSVYVNSTSTYTASTSIAEQTPGTTLWIGVASVDEVGNESILTATQPFDVIETVCYWEYYKQNGGEETGGFCQVSSTAPQGKNTLLLVGLGLCMAGLVRRRKKS